MNDTKARTAQARNLDVAEWVADACRTVGLPDEPTRNATERSFRRVHADPRYRARLWL